MSTKAALSAVGIQKVFPTVELESRELWSRHAREVHHLIPGLLSEQAPGRAPSLPHPHHPALHCVEDAMLPTIMLITIVSQGAGDKMVASACNLG